MLLKGALPCRHTQHLAVGLCLATWGTNVPCPQPSAPNWVCRGAPLVSTSFTAQKASLQGKKGEERVDVAQAEWVWVL